MDRGQKETEAILKQIEKRINQEYKQAIDEIEDQLSDYLRRFEIKDKKWQEWVESGYKTEDQYKKWRMQQMAVGQKWSEQKEQIAYELAHVNETAKSLAKMAAPEIFAENANYSTFKIEKDAKIDTGFTLYSRESVAELIANDPEVLPPVGKKVARDIAMGKAVKWNRQQLQSVMMQGILQGDSIPKLATRLANTVGDRDRKAAIRNARTMATAAQNAGREQSYKNAQAKGIELEQMWIATLDSRTRHSHRWLDGERKPVGEPFSNGCRYPADPEGAPAEIYNCRCTLRAVVKGLERRSGQFRDTSAMDGMTYDEWRDAKATSNPITLPEEKGKAIKESYVNEYRYGGRTKPINGLGNGQNNQADSDIINNNIAYVVAQDITQAKEYAQNQLGISLNNFDKANVNFVNRLNEELTKVYNEFGNLHDKGVLDTAYVINKKVSYEAAYVPALNQLTFRSAVVNTKNGLSNMAKDAKVCFEAGYWSTPAAEHSIRHEIGHAIEKIVENNPDINDELTKIRESMKAKHNITEVIDNFYDAHGNLKTDDIAKCKDVGKDFCYYGLKNNGELIAEAFAEYMNGTPREYAKKVMDIVKKGM